MSAPDRPEYGEYATPEEQRAAIKEPLDYGHVEPDAVLEASAAPVQPYGSGPRAPQDPFAPHQNGQQDPFGRDGYGRMPQQPFYQGAQPGVPRRPSTADRVLTVVLLFLGAWNVFSMWSLVLSHGQVLQAEQSVLGAESAITDVPSWVWLVNAISYLVIWVVALAMSVARVRSGRLSFWVPLVAGVIATIVVFAVVIIAIGQNPSLLHDLQSATGSSV